jgi:hypothetical protein
MLLLALSTQNVRAQHFDFAAKEAIKVPTPVVAQLCHHIEKRDGGSMTIGGKYLYVPVYNVLNRSQK